MTNADAIRAMTDEELATVVTDYACGHVTVTPGMPCDRPNCEPCALRWLREECKEEAEE